MRQAAQDLGITLPDTHGMAAAAVAALIVALAAAAGWAVGKYAGPRLAAHWERKAGEGAEAIVPRLCAVVRYLLIWLVLAIALRVEPWPPLASLILGLFAAIAAAALVRHVARGLRASRWVSWLLAAFLFVATLAEAVGGLKPLMETLDSVAYTIGNRRLSLLNLVQIAAALLALYLVVRLVNRIAGAAIHRATGLDPAQQLLTQKLVGIFILTIAFFLAIDLAGIDLTALAVFSGAFGLAVGFGLQKTFGNLFAGIILLWDRSIKPGDVIVVGDSFGTVNKIGVRAVSVITRDGKEHLIPNEELMTREVENWSYSNTNVRLHIPVGVAYDCDLPLAQQLMVQAASECPRVLKVPKPSVWLRAFGENSIEHEVLAWVGDPDAGIGSVQSEILNRLWHLFREHRIEVPFPQRDVRVKEWPPGTGDTGGPPP